MRLDLEAILERAKAASPGPWQQQPDTHAGRVWVQRHSRHHHFGPDCEPLFSLRGSEDYGQRESDAAFIAHAREDVPALIAEVARLRGVLNDIYPSLASRAMQLVEAGEERAAARWTAICRKVASTW